MPGGVKGSRSATPTATSSRPSGRTVRWNESSSAPTSPVRPRRPMSRQAGWHESFIWPKGGLSFSRPSFNPDQLSHPTRSQRRPRPPARAPQPNPCDPVHMLEVAVGRHQIGSRLHGMRGNPDVVRGNGTTLRAERRRDPRVPVGGGLSDRHDRHVRIVEESAHPAGVVFVTRAVPEPVQKLAEHDRRQQNLRGVLYDPACLLVSDPGGRENPALRRPAGRRRGAVVGSFQAWP